METKPLHKKKKRLAKQRSAQRDSDQESNFVKEFIIYNRFKELKRKAMEAKENEWQKELEYAMANSNISPLETIPEKYAIHSRSRTSNAIAEADEDILPEAQIAVSSEPQITVQKETQTENTPESEVPPVTQNQFLSCHDTATGAASLKATQELENIDFIDKTPSPRTMNKPEAKSTRSGKSHKL